MSLNAINNASSSLINHAGKTKGADGKMGKEDFMNLFMTQMSHQDPMKPTDSSQMMQQLSQLASVEQMQAMNSKLETLNNKQSEIARYQVMQFLDKDVYTDGNRLDFKKGVSSPVSYSLENDVKDIKLRIKNSDGELIANRNLGLQESGRHKFVWDGKTDMGAQAADGKYTIELSEVDNDDRVSPVKTFVTGRAQSIEYRKGNPYIGVGNKMVPAGEIRSIDTKSDRMFRNSSPLPLNGDLSPKPIAVKVKG